MIRVLLKDLDAKMIKISEVMSSPPPYTPLILENHLRLPEKCCAKNLFGTLQLLETLKLLESCL